MIEILKLAPEIHRVAKEKGFWLTPNLGEKVMLIILQLSKAVEAYQSGRRAEIDKFLQIWPAEGTLISEATSTLIISKYQAHVLNTVEDELTNTAMRILDFIYYRGFNLTEQDLKDGFAVSNFAEACLNIAGSIYHAYQSTVDKESLWGWVLVKIEALCKFHNIDLEELIRWKLLYNTYRNQSQ